jgi:N-acetyl-anhydromuramyl-L-alanine amidase AmpD
MATKRQQTNNIVVLVSDTTPNASEFVIASKYRDKGAPGIGSHYLVTEWGDVIKVRPNDEHGNVHADFNKDSIYIEVVGTVDTYRPSEAQHGAVTALVEILQETYLDAEELDWTA